jgi:uncharacterized protein (UPF0212 family)
MDLSGILTAALECPNCDELTPCAWLAPEDGDEDVEPGLQSCGSCGHIWTAEWPGYSFRTEAG